MIHRMRFVGLALVASAIAGCGGGSSTPQASNSAESPAAADSTIVPEPAVAIDSQKIEQSLSAAHEYITSQELAKAQVILLKLIEKAPREVRAYELLGQVFNFQSVEASRRGDSAAAADLRVKAFEQYQKAVQIDPKSAGLQQSAGVMAMAAARTDDALTHFVQAATLDPRNPQYSLFAAQLLIQRRRFDEAKTYLERVLAVDPDESVAHASLAVIAMETGDFDRAIVHAREARRIDPANVDVRVQEAKVLRRAGRPREALEVLVGLSANERAQEAVAYEISASYEDMKEYLNAARAWEHCVKVNPLSDKAWQYQTLAASLLLTAGEREQAWMWLQQAKLAAPNAPEVKELEAAFKE
jgi:tetratricopeptide (TPR) repeat protein